MKVPSLKIGELICHKPSAGRSSPAASSFAEILQEASTFKNPVAEPAGDVLPIGVISAKNPTVSDLLISNSQFRNDAWSILRSARNAGKDFARMQPGTMVSIDKDSGELIWEGQAAPSPARPAQDAVQPAARQGEQAAGPVSEAEGGAAGRLPAAAVGEAGTAGGEKICLGRLDGQHSTVSHLLLENPGYGRQAWRIIQADINRDKSFTDIPAGAEIFIDRQTLELSWRQSSPPPAAAAAEQAEQEAAVAVPAEEESPAAEADQPDLFSSNLVRAVQSYLGRSYREINCYGLVVRGLSRMGIQYGGRGGLQDQLVQTARSRGLPENAYLTGEGLIEVSGAKVFTKTLNSVGNAEKTADSIYAEMAPYLQKGYILSFSTPSRGHTGVISQHDQRWTFINSGYLDNQVEKTGRAKGVGEEDLAGEIRNWCWRAAKKGESLIITLGRLDEGKLRTAQRGTMPSGQQV